MLGWPHKIRCAAVLVSARKVLQALKVVLHIGAHRTGTTSLQSGLRQNRFNLRKNGVVFWGPQQLRGETFSGLLRREETQAQAHTKILVRRNCATIGFALDRLRRTGQTHLVISEENIMGMMRENITGGCLYPNLAGRLARFRRAFDGQRLRVVLAVRPYQAYWTSVLGHLLPRGLTMPGPDALESLAQEQRGWRDVIADVGTAFPGAEIVVWGFQGLIGDTVAQFCILLGGAVQPPFQACAAHHNKSPDVATLNALAPDAHASALIYERHVFQPFSATARAVMHDRFAQDMHWLRCGGGGRVQFFENAETAAGLGATGTISEAG